MERRRGRGKWEERKERNEWRIWRRKRGKGITEFLRNTSDSRKGVGERGDDGKRGGEGRGKRRFGESGKRKRGRGLQSLRNINHNSKEGERKGEEGERVEGKKGRERKGKGRKGKRVRKDDEL